METLATGRYTFLSEGLIIIADVQDGQIVKTVGEVVKAEQIEMNVVKVTARSGKEQFLELGDNVRWIPEREVN